MKLPRETASCVTVRGDQGGDTHTRHGISRVTTETLRRHDTRVDKEIVSGVCKLCTSIHTVIQIHNPL